MGISIECSIVKVCSLSPLAVALFCMKPTTFCMKCSFRFPGASSLIHCTALFGHRFVVADERGDNPVQDRPLLCVKKEVFEEPTSSQKVLKHRHLYSYVYRDSSETCARGYLRIVVPKVN